jgi:hypothetical protein
MMTEQQQELLIESILDAMIADLRHLAKMITDGRPSEAAAYALQLAELMEGTDDAS